MALTWYLDVDWDNNGSYEANEAAYMVDLKTERGRDNLIKPDGRGFERWAVGKAWAKLTNYDRRFDAYNTDGALYGNLLPGRPARIRVNDGATTHTLFTGRIANIKPIDRGSDRMVQVYMEDGIRFLRNEVATVTLVESRATEDAISDVLTAISWPAAWGSTLGTAVDTLEYFWADDDDAYDWVMGLAESEWGQFWVAADGKAKFLGRHTTSASQATFTSDLVRREIGLPIPWEAIRNSVVVTAYPRKEQSAAELWRLTDIRGINPGAEVIVYAQLAYDGRVVPGKSLTCVATTDYTFNSAADGSGDDLTSDFTVALTAYGARPKVTITSAASVVGYPTLLRIQGVAVDCASPSILKATNSTSITKFGPRVLKADFPWQQNTESARGLAHGFKTEFGVESPFPTIEIDDRATIQFPRDLVDRITVTIARLGVDADYRIGKIEHRWLTPTGQQVRTKFKTEPFMDIEDFWIFPTKIGETSVFAP